MKMVYCINVLLFFQFQDISPTDGLPQNLCSTCIKQLLSCNSFRQVCVTSADFLQSVIAFGQAEEHIENGTEDAERKVHKMKSDELVDIEYIQSEIETEAVEPEEPCEDDSNVEYYIEYITESTPPKLELDHDYYIDPTEVEMVDMDGQVLADDEEYDETHADESKSDETPIADPTKDLCIICGSLQSHGNLRRHMETHLGEKRKQPFECPHCDRKFINRPSFVAHVNKHTGVRPFKCKVCDKAFYGANLLRTHMHSHSTENKYACTECNKVFRYPHYLSQHRRIHKANTVYSCDHCDYTNVYLHNYKNHLRKHTGQYRFKCEICSKGFGRKFYYTKHMNKHTVKDEL